MGGGSGWEAGKGSTPSPLRIIDGSVYHQLNRLPSKSRAWRRVAGCECLLRGQDGAGASLVVPCWAVGDPQRAPHPLAMGWSLGSCFPANGEGRDPFPG